MISNLYSTLTPRKRFSIATAGSALALSGLLVTGTAQATTSLVAAAQTPAVLATYTQGLTLTTHATVPSGETASIASLTTSSTHGVVTKVSSTSVTYYPGSYYASLAKGSTATDKFSFCLTDTGGDSSCSTVTVTVYGAAAATASTTTTASTSYTCVRNWYVAQNGSDKAAGSSATTPWLTLQHADTSGLLKAGDCVNVANGTYPMTSTAYLNTGGSSNSATGYIVYRSINPHGAKIQASAVGMGDMINAMGNYMIFDGFEIDGGNLGLISLPMTTGSCLIGQGHHFQVLNSLVHDCGGEAIGAMFHDWYTFVGNTVYNNAHFSLYQASGISIYEPRAVTFTATAADTAATYHILVKNNVSHDNGEWYVAGDHSDGNGIIMDDFRNSQTGHAAYPYTALVQGNTSYNNGGRGIHVFSTDNITVDSNIVYNNNLDDLIIGPWRGELSNVGGNNNTWTNNQAAATSVSTDAQRQYNTAVLDADATNVNVTWSNNANIDTRTGGKSYLIGNTTRAATFPTYNPLGKAL